MIWANAAVQGILLGGLYALFATGLSLLFGVMRLVNLAHGDLAILAAFGSLLLIDHTGMPPFVTMLIVIPVMALLGAGLQLAFFDRSLELGVFAPLLVTFGLSIIIENGLQQALLGRPTEHRHRVAVDRVAEDHVWHQRRMVRRPGPRVGGRGAHWPAADAQPKPDRANHQGSR